MSKKLVHFVEQYFTADGWYGIKVGKYLEREDHSIATLESYFKWFTEKEAKQLDVKKYIEKLWAGFKYPKGFLQKKMKWLLKELEEAKKARAEALHTAKENKKKSK